MLPVRPVFHAVTGRVPLPPPDEETMSAGEIFARYETNIANNVEKATSVNAKFGFDLAGDDGGQWTLDLRKENAAGPWVSEGIASDANVTISMSSADWAGIDGGKVNPMQAFMMGKIKVKGDMQLAMKLQNILSLGKA